RRSNSLGCTSLEVASFLAFARRLCATLRAHGRPEPTTRSEGTGAARPPPARRRHRAGRLLEPGAHQPHRERVPARLRFRVARHGAGEGPLARHLDAAPHEATPPRAAEEPRALRGTLRRDRGWGGRGAADSLS